MEKHFKTIGIVLRRIDFGEADQMVHVLTRDEGKIRVVAKGGRRLKSKFLGKLELLNQVEINYFQGRELGYLNEVTSHPLLQENRFSLRARGLLFYVAEVTNKMVADDQESHKIYALLHDFLEGFEEDAKESIFYAYLIKLLTELGFMGDWSHCHETNQKLNLSQPYFLSTLDGDLTRHAYLAQGTPPVRPALIKWVNYLQKNSFNQLKAIRSTQEEQKEMSQLLKRIFQTITPHPFKSESFIRLV